jgi:hypothetical protein
VQLAIVCASVSVDFGFFVPLEYAPHRPLAIYKATVAHLEHFAAQAAWALNRLHFGADREYAKALVDDDQLLMRKAFRILAVTKPAEAVRDLSIPRSILFPSNFLNVFNRIEGEVNPERNLEAL